MLSKLFSYASPGILEICVTDNQHFQDHGILDRLPNITHVIAIGWPTCAFLRQFSRCESLKKLTLQPHTYTG